MEVERVERRRGEEGCGRSLAAGFYFLLRSQYTELKDAVRHKFIGAAAESSLFLG